MYYVYVLYNKIIDRYYIGLSTDPEKRLKDHKRGKSKRHFVHNQKGNWIIKYQEEFNTRGEAYKRELEIKSKKSRKYIEDLIK